MNNVKKINNIMVRLFNVVLKLEERALKESTVHNLSMTEMHTLDAIGLGKPKTMGEVAGILRISISTLTTAINRLVKKEYVERFRIPEDRRIVKLKLTESGIAVVKEHESFHNNMIKDAVSKLSPEEVETFLESLENINQFMTMQETPPIKDREAYELKPIKLGNLIVEKPLFQGGMGIGISLGKLAGTVAKEGCVGMISAAEIGFLESDYEENRLEANKRALKSELKRAFEIRASGKGQIGVNIPYSTENYREYVETAISCGAEIIVSGAGLPMSLPDICRDSDVIRIPVISSARAARVIMKNWQKKHNAIPDAFIFEGSMAGGQLGYKDSKIRRAKDNYYKTILEIKKEIGDVPLIVAGGIYQREDAKNVFAYGADGIQLGTRFVTTKECDANDKIKKAFIEAAEADVQIYSPEGERPYRALKNDTFEGQDSINMTKALINAAKGDLEQGIVFCGTNVFKAKKIETVKNVIWDFFDQ